MNNLVTILDVDGTLVDVRPALHHLLNDSPDESAFFAETMRCPVHRFAVNYAHEHYHSGQKLIIFTSRLEKYREHTTRWLQKNFPLPYELLLMRGDNDKSSDIEVKKRMLNIIMCSGFVPTHAIDDTLDILHLWRDHGISVTPMPILRDLSGRYPLDAAVVWRNEK